MKANQLIDACGGLNEPDLRWRLYCVANGNQPAVQKQLDTIKWPGNPIDGFTQWLRAHLADFIRENPLTPPESFEQHRERCDAHLASVALRSYEAVLKARDEAAQPIEMAENAS